MACCCLQGREICCWLRDDEEDENATASADDVDEIRIAVGDLRLRAWIEGRV